LFTLDADGYAGPCIDDVTEKEFATVDEPLDDAEPTVADGFTFDAAPTEVLDAGADEEGDDAFAAAGPRLIPNVKHLQFIQAVVATTPPDVAEDETERVKMNDVVLRKFGYRFRHPGMVQRRHYLDPHKSQERAANQRFTGVNLGRAALPSAGGCTHVADIPSLWPRSSSQYDGKDVLSPTASSRIYFRPSSSRISLKTEQYKQTSPFAHLPNWRLKAFIVKTGDELVKEMVAMQAITYVTDVLTRHESVDVLIRPYDIQCVKDSGCGFVEYIDNAESVDAIKKSGLVWDAKSGNSGLRATDSENALGQRPASSFAGASLKDYFLWKFGPSTGLQYQKAIDNFVRSLAGYSLLTYILQVHSVTL
jgi:hypothetical protein